MPELKGALEGLVGDDLSQRFIIDPADRIPLVTTGDNAYYGTAWRIAHVSRIDPTPVPVDTTIDLTGTDGSRVVISGTGVTTDTITMDDNKSLELEFTDSGNILTNSGGNLIISGDTIQTQAGMKLRLTKIGTDVECVPMTHITTLGDADGTGNGNRLIVDDDAEVITVSGFTVYAGQPLGVVRIGDSPGGIGNSTRIEVNDANASKTIEMVADEGVTINGDDVLTATRPIVPVTDAASPYTVTAGQSGTIFTNEGTAGNVTFELPASAGCDAGKTRFTFANVDTTTTYKNLVKVNGTDHLYIYSGSNLDITAGGTTNDGVTPGASLTVVYQGGGIWITESFNGPWV